MPDVWWGRFVFVGCGAAGGVLAASGPALAIPSPELVIGSVSSLSQLGALLAAMFGGSAVFAGFRARMRSDGTSGRSRLAWRLCLASMCLAMLLGGLNVYQFTSNTATEVARLQSTLLRPSRLPGQAVLDPTLRQISFADQKTHPLGIDTTDAEALVASGKALLLDVRETGEHEMGTLPGARHVRFPDLARSGIDLAGRKVVLFCHNGNRSFETCERLAAMGIDCRFIRGGIEKWIVEGRPFTDPKVRGLSDLRSLPEYPGAQTLIGTQQASQLIANGGTTIVDVRYPGEFAASHLPGAVNIPIRRLSTADLAKTIADLPRQPVVAACYDRRSCFSSQVLGLELSRAGLEFIGRYTLPWEYYAKKPPKPHVAAWMAEQRRGLWQTAIDTLAGWLEFLAGKTGVVIAILIAAVLSRLVVLPVALKAERDQIAMRANAAELKTLKVRLKGDAARMGPALKAFYSRHGITPMRNMLALLFLPVMMLNLTAIGQMAGAVPAGPAWMESLSVPDPVYALPVLFAVLGGAYLDQAFVKTRRQRMLVWALAVPALAVLVAGLPAAGTLYLAVSMVLLLVQRAWVLQWPHWLFEMPQFLQAYRQDRYFGEGVIPLSDPRRLANCGNKTYHLAILAREGIAVPQGAVLSARFLKELARYAPEARETRLDRVFARLDLGRVAVRSSAEGEDGGAHSFAGVFESVLNVDASRFAQAVDMVERSFASVRAGSYHHKAGSGNILVQQMIDAEYSGVLFSRDPAHPGAMLVEMVEGIAEDLVSGRVTPLSCRFGRGSGDLLDGDAPDLDLAPLLAIARRCEAIFGAPQDIEWVYAGGRFMIVQTRDITATAQTGSDPVAVEWARLAGLAGDGAGDEVILQQDEMSEVLPRPTPFSLALMQRLWSAGGSVEMACRRLGLRYPLPVDGACHLHTVFGRLYADTRTARDIQVKVTALAARRMRRSPRCIADEFTSGFLPGFLEDMAVLQSADVSQLDRHQLLKLARTTIEEFVNVTHVEVEIINIAASFYAGDARTRLQQAGHDPALWLAAEDSNPLIAALQEAKQKSNGDCDRLLRQSAGHRSMFDYELSAPRYAEDIEALRAQADALALHPVRSRVTCAVAANMKSLGPALADAVEIARLYQGLKETAKHHALRQLAVLRKLLVRLDEDLSLDGGIFFLQPDELAGLGHEAHAALLEWIAHRRQHSEALLETPALPAALTRRRLERGMLADAADTAADDGAIAGQRVAGKGAVFGRARVIDCADSERGILRGEFSRGDILVCKMAHPAWLAEMLKSGGVVCEVGGWLSHMAIVAREHDIPMITGARAALSIPEGAHIRLLPDGRVDLLDTNAGTEDRAHVVALTG